MDDPIVRPNAKKNRWLKIICIEAEDGETAEVYQVEVAPKTSSVSADFEEIAEPVFVRTLYKDEHGTWPFRDGVHPRWYSNPVPAACDAVLHRAGVIIGKEYKRS